MAGTLERSERRGDARIGVCHGGGHNVSREGGIVASAVIHMQDQAQIQDHGLQLGVRAISAQELQNILRHGTMVQRRMNGERTAVVVVMIGLIRIDRQHREEADQLQTLTEYIGQRDIVRLVVIGIQCQNRAGQTVHHIAARRLHDHVAHKILRQGTIENQQLLKVRQLLFCRKLSEHQEIGDFLKSEPVVRDDTIHQVFDGIPAVIKMPVIRHLVPVRILLLGAHLTDIGETCKHTLAVQVTQTALDIQLRIKGIVYFVIAL